MIVNHILALHTLITPQRDQFIEKVTQFPVLIECNKPNEIKQFLYDNIQYAQSIFWICEDTFYLKTNQETTHK